MLQVARSRSRQIADSQLTLKSGTKSAGSSSGGTLYYWYNSSALSAVALPSSIVYSGVTISLSGVTVHSSVYSGTTYYWYNIQEVVARVRTYSSALIAARQAELLGAHAGAMTTSNTYRLANASESMNDVVTKDFKKLSRQGAIIMTPCSRSKSSVTLEAFEGFITEPTWSLGTVAWGYTGGTNHLTRQWYLTVNVAWTSYTRVNFGVNDVVLGALRSGIGLDSLPHLSDESAINSAFEKVYQAELDVPVILAEAKKTFTLLESSLRRLNNVIGAIKNWRAKTSYRNAKPRKLAALWLEYRYAWSPLIGDIRTALHMLSDGKTFSPRRTFRGWDDDGEQESIDYTYSSGGFTYRVTGSKISSRVVRAGILTQIDLLGLSVARDYGALGGPGVIWELIPYSFVVDWLVDVSGFLQSINPSAIIKTLGSWSTQISEKRFSGIIEVTHDASGNKKYLKYSDISYSYIRTPNVSATFINLDINMSTTRIVDTISLIVRRLR